MRERPLDWDVPTRPSHPSARSSSIWERPVQPAELVVAVVAVVLMLAELGPWPLPFRIWILP